MGDPKKQHKHYSNVKRPWDKSRIEQEKTIVQKYGTRRKKELRKAETILRNLRQRARALIGSKNEKEEALLLKKTYEQGLTEKEATIDSILGLKIESILERRLQTMLLKKNLANTPLQARQFITHGHIAIDSIKVTSPSYLTKIHEENKITYIPKSSLNQTFKPKEKEEPKPKRAPEKESKPKKTAKEHKEKDKEPKKEESKTEKAQEKESPAPKKEIKKDDKKEAAPKKPQKNKKEIKAKKDE